MDVPSPQQITQLLLRWSEGDEYALDALIPLVYKNLRRMAGYQIRNERKGHTLQPTALVHEAYIKLVDRPKMVWESRAHFLAVAARAMRQILVDYARHRNGAKGPGGKEILPLDEALVFAPARPQEWIALDQALVRLSLEDVRKARVVELRYYGGLSNEEIASVLGISSNTVIRDWNMGRSRLMQMMRNDNLHERGKTQED